MIDSWHSTCVMHLQITALDPFFTFSHFSFYHSRLKPYELDRESPLTSYFQLDFITRDPRMKSRERDIYGPGSLLLRSPCVVCNTLLKNTAFFGQSYFRKSSLCFVVTVASLRLRDYNGNCSLISY